MSIQNRLTKLEALTQTSTEAPLRIAFFDPDGDTEPNGLIDDDGVTTLRLENETVRQLQQRAKNNSVWITGKWHNYINIY